MTYLVMPVLLLLITLLVYRHWQNPYRGVPMYVCVEDGENSPLYLCHTRVHSFAGGFAVDRYKRVTCVPGEKYTSAVSDWFDPWCGYSRKMLCHFKPVSQKEAERLLATQLSVTRAVAKQIALAKKAGAIKPNQGFSAVGDVA